MINQFSTIVKLSNPNVKTLLSIKGENDVFGKMAKEAANPPLKQLEQVRLMAYTSMPISPSSPSETKDFETLLDLWRKVVDQEIKLCFHGSILFYSSAWKLVHPNQHDTTYFLKLMKQLKEIIFSKMVKSITPK